MGRDRCWRSLGRAGESDPGGVVVREVLNGLEAHPAAHVAVLALVVEAADDSPSLRIREIRAEQRYHWHSVPSLIFLFAALQSE